MSVMWSSPSTPPRSMKAPKSVMFLTMPFRTWPPCSCFSRPSRLVLRSASSSTRRLTTMLRRRLFSLMILNSKLWPRSSSMLGTRRSAIWLPGRNASTPIRSTTTPPLIFLTSVPVTPSSFSCASRIRSQTRMKSAFFFESTTAPSWSSRCSRKTSTSSPSLRLLGSLNSSIGTAPSDLKPTSRMTAVSVTRSTFDFTISPSSMFESVPSYSSVILAISSGEYSSSTPDILRSCEWVVFLGGRSGAESSRSCASTSIRYRFSSEFGHERCPGRRPGSLWGPRNLPWEPFPRQRYDPRDLVCERQMCRVEQDGVCRRSQRRHRPARVGRVTSGQRLALASQPGLVGRLPPPSSPSPLALGNAAPGSLLRLGGEEDFERRLGEDHGTDVPPVHHDAGRIRLRRPALLRVDPGPDLGERRHRRHLPGDPLRADGLLDVHAGDRRNECALRQHQLHGEGLAEIDDLLRFPFPLSPFPDVVERGERHGSIQSPGIEMRPSPPPPPAPPPPPPGRGFPGGPPPPKPGGAPPPGESLSGPRKTRGGIAPPHPPPRRPPPPPGVPRTPQS